MLMLWWGPPPMHICGEQTKHTHVRERGERSHQHRSLTRPTKKVGSWSKRLAAGAMLWGQAKAEACVSHLKKTSVDHFWVKICQEFATHLFPFAGSKEEKKKKEKSSILEFMGGHGGVLRPWQLDFFCFISISELLIQHKRNIDLCHIRIANTTRDLHKLGWK